MRSNDLPIKTVNGATVYMHDVAQVRDGYGGANQHRPHQRLSRSAADVLKNGKASTLDIIKQMKKAAPRRLKPDCRQSCKLKQLFDQSLFVRASINGVLREAAIAAALTGLMILLFLGSWRSTLIVCISIPLSILTSLIVLASRGRPSTL